MAALTPTCKTRTDSRNTNPKEHHVTAPDFPDEAATVALCVPNPTSDPHGLLAFERIRDRADAAYEAAQDDATSRGLAGRQAHQHALDAVLDAVGRGYAAAAIHQATETVTNRIDEATYLALGDISLVLDLEVIEDLTGANSTREDDQGSESAMVQIGEASQ